MLVFDIFNINFSCLPFPPWSPSRLRTPALRGAEVVKPVMVVISVDADMKKSSNETSEVINRNIN